jgi:hypothetical protein
LPGARDPISDGGHNYKLAATWLTPEVIRATARLLQLRSRMSEQQARDLVTEAETGIDTAFIVEIDPREGSGVIPQDWEAFLQVKERAGASVRGTIESRLRDVRALAGVLRRNYDYDRFWVTFPTTVDGKPLLVGRSCRAADRAHPRQGSQGEMACAGLATSAVTRKRLTEFLAPGAI